MMSKSCISVAIVLAVAWFTVATAAHAQISTSVDEHGKHIFVNGDSPARGSGSTMNLRAPASAQTKSSPPDRFDGIVLDAAARHKVDPALIKAVIDTESGWNPRAISRKGAVGLMQLIPETAQRFGGGNLLDPAQNVEAGTTYLKALLDRYDGDLTKSLAAYNAGERAVDQSGGIPGYPETVRYVRKVTDAYFRPGSGRESSFWSAPKVPVRREVDSNGRVIFTNE
jgi:soluble lytic murein transglycosylase-like protein